MIVAITDGRANISLKRSTDPEAAASDAPRPSAQELKVNYCIISIPNPSYTTASGFDQTVFIRFVCINKHCRMRFLKCPGKYTKQECPFLLLTLKTSSFQLVLLRKSPE